MESVGATLHPLSRLRERVGVRVHSLSRSQERVGVRACIAPTSLGSYTSRRFSNTYKNSINLNRACAFLILVITLQLPATTSADPWLAPGDVSMRHDLELLADVGVIKGPITQWPLPWPDIARDVTGTGSMADLSPGTQAALDRVRRAARHVMRTGEITRHARIAGSSEPDALRGFGATPREEGELEGGIDWTGDRFAFRLQATAVANADDGKTWRPDGSYVGVTLWNLMFSAGYMERWWGPGWDGSLILSTSARPIPALTVERNYSDPFTWPVLKLFGPWRASIMFGALEDDREDFDETRFFAARVTFKPWRHLEIGLSRSAQWCGEGRPCDASTFWDLFSGNDNDQDPTQQPGNQLAGYDVRLSSPWRSLPLALYGQMIGEDEAGFLPSKFLGLFGAEVWGSIGQGSYRVRAEYGETSCSFSYNEPEFDCAYESSIYTQGYRFRDRSIGHAMDSDGKITTVGAIYVEPGGSSWELRARTADLNRDALAPEPNHTIAALATELESVDLYHRRELLGGRLTAGIGFERREVPSLSSQDDEWRVTAEWLRDF